HLADRGGEGVAEHRSGQRGHGGKGRVVLHGKGEDREPRTAAGDDDLGAVRADLHSLWRKVADDLREQFARHEDPARLVDVDVDRYLGGDLVVEAGQLEPLPFALVLGVQQHPREDGHRRADRQSASGPGDGVREHVAFDPELHDRSLFPRLPRNRRPTSRAHVSALPGPTDGSVRVGMSVEASGGEFTTVPRFGRECTPVGGRVGADSPAKTGAGEEAGRSGALSTEIGRARLLSHEISLCGAVVIGAVDTVDNPCFRSSPQRFLSTEHVDDACGKLGALWTGNGCPQVIHKSSTGYPRLYPQIHSWDDWMSRWVIHNVSTGCPQENVTCPQGYPRLIHSLGCVRRPWGTADRVGIRGHEPRRGEWIHSGGRGLGPPVTLPWGTVPGRGPGRAPGSSR